MVSICFTSFASWGSSVPKTLCNFFQPLPPIIPTKIKIHIKIKTPNFKRSRWKEWNFENPDGEEQCTNVGKWRGWDSEGWGRDCGGPFRPKRSDESMKRCVGWELLRGVGDENPNQRTECGVLWKDEELCEEDLRGFGIAGSESSIGLWRGHWVWAKKELKEKAPPLLCLNQVWELRNISQLFKIGRLAFYIFDSLRVWGPF